MKYLLPLMLVLLPFASAAETQTVLPEGYQVQTVHGNHTWSNESWGNQTIVTFTGDGTVFARISNGTMTTTLVVPMPLDAEAFTADLQALQGDLEQIQEQIQDLPQPSNYTLSFDGITSTLASEQERLQQLQRDINGLETQLATLNASLTNHHKGMSNSVRAIEDPGAPLGLYLVNIAAILTVAGAWLWPRLQGRLPVQTAPAAPQPPRQRVAAPDPSEAFEA